MKKQFTCIRLFFLVLSLAGTLSALQAQTLVNGGGISQAPTPDSLIRELKAINSSVATAPCTTGKGDLVSNRALNIFLSNKAGSYLSAVDNLTLYKNSMVADASQGAVGLYHNLYQPKGPDDRVRSFLSIGARANAADAFAAAFTGRQFNNQFGMLLKQTWIGKGHTSFTACPSVNASQVPGPSASSSSGPSQKITMDALRAGILHSLITEINHRCADFESSLNAMDSASDSPGQSLDAAKNIARQKFNADLRQEYEYKFALLQSEALASTFDYKVVAVNWTSISIYVPVITEKFQAAASFADPLRNQNAYPLHANITHTWLWEDSRYGRFFVSVAGDASLNNSRDAYAMYRTSYADYKNLGGADTIHAAQFRSDDLYIGEYKTFVTPTLKGQLVYIPANSHIGISFLLEQNIGIYNALNGVLGVPIVLISKTAEPSINFEFQLRFFDIGNKIGPSGGLPGKTSVGLTVGVPFSKIVY